MKIILYAIALSFGMLLPRAAETPTAATGEKQTARLPDPAEGVGLSLVSTNHQVLLDALARPSPDLKAKPNDSHIARVTADFLGRQHYLQRPVDDAISAQFLERYLETLDNARVHYLQSDVEEFEKYRTTLDELTARQGDVGPAHEIFMRFLQRLEQRAAYVGELLNTEKFEFTGDDRYNLNRKGVPRPKDLDAAKQLWRQHLRYEILQEKLNKEKPEEISKKINRRYARLIRTFKDLDSDDILEIYLSALTRVYDPHSDYMGKSALESFNISMKLSLFGIGALLQAEDGYCRIKSLVPGGPAALSKKIQPNDRIIAVAQGDNDAVDVVDWKLNKVVELIRGPKGSEVHLTIIPAEATDTSVRKLVSLIRDEIKLEDQEAKAQIIDLPDETGKKRRLGLIDLPSFYADFDPKPGERPKSTTDDVSKLLKKLKQEKVEGIILDLRHNGGGSLEEAINLTGLFIKEGPVVQVRDPRGKTIVDEDPNASVLYDGPMLVLTSRFSASASEILAGALQDYGRALIAGDSSTHGKGTVQSLIQLRPILSRQLVSGQDPGALKLTIRKFYRPSGISTQLRGVIPDMVLPSLNNLAEVGEASLDNPLDGNPISAAQFEKLNRIQPILPELQQRSAKRLDKDTDFQYLREDMEQMKKALADRTISLNEAQRVKEKEEAEERVKARKAERKERPESSEVAYEITLKNADVASLPAPMARKKEDDSTDKSASLNQPGVADAEAATEDAPVGAIDITLKEAKRIMVDLITLLSETKAVATAGK